MFVDIDRAGFVVSAVVGGCGAAWAYGSYAGYDDSGMLLLALTGALSGIGFWLLSMNDYLGLKR